MGFLHISLIICYSKPYKSYYVGFPLNEVVLFFFQENDMLTMLHLYDAKYSETKNTVKCYLK